MRSDQSCESNIEQISTTFCDEGREGIYFLKRKLQIHKNWREKIFFFHCCQLFVEEVYGTMKDKGSLRKKSGK